MDMQRKDIALVLSSGGPRGFAYIGAIEELLSRGYRITSVAGSSVGSLVGGIYAAGALDAFKQWLFALDNFKVMALMDVSISRRYLVKGERVIEAIKKVVPDVDIRSLSIPYCAVATDLYTGEEIVFREGPLFDAIRSSISIPSMFRPVNMGHRTLVDGGVVNTFPLDRVARSGEDLLVGFNVNAVDAEHINLFLQERERLTEEEMRMTEAALSVKGSLIERVKAVGARGQELVKERRAARELVSQSRSRRIPTDADDNYYTILDRSFSLMNNRKSVV
jgi:NTE family protein